MSERPGRDEGDRDQRASADWKSFLDNRNWDAVHQYYRNALDPQKARPEDFIIPDVGSGGAGWFGRLDPAREAAKSGSGRDRRSTFLVEIDYLGSGFQGVQINRGIRTVMGCIAQGLEEALGGESPQAVATAGRTDAGVHAIGQVLSFSTWATISEQRLAAALSVVAPSEIRVVRVAKVHRSFHANFVATWRRYLYLFPLTHPCEVDCEALRRQLAGVTGQPLPFNALAYARIRGWGEREDADVCTLHRTAATPVEVCGVSAVAVEVSSDRFLRRMVRVLVSTAIRAAVQGCDPLELRRIVLAGRRDGAALPAPSAGLCLSGVGYEPYDASAGGAAIHAPSAVPKNSE